MLADGGECVSDLAAVRDQQPLFGGVASDSTAFRVVDRVASERLLEQLRAAHARARERFWKLRGAPERLTIDIDATLVTAHSEKEGAAGTYQGRLRVSPLCRRTRMRPARRWVVCSGRERGRNTAADHKVVLDRALAQVPVQ